jgi:site-specific DNA-methyltransferase (adenine-specific)
MTVELRQGRWQNVCADVDCVDAVVVDPPYGPRTHSGDVSAAVQQQSATGQPLRRSITYDCWMAHNVHDFVSAWAPRCRGWFVAMTSHDLINTWEHALREHDRYVFAPLPWVEKRPRLIGDGPANWTVYIIVARPRNREFATWGCLDGAYISQRQERKPVVGGKPLWLMRALIRDYTRPGDLVCDPCAGGGTTLIAAKLEGRRAIGAEQDPETFKKAQQRLAYCPESEWQPGLFGQERP